MKLFFTLTTLALFMSSATYAKEICDPRINKECVCERVPVMSKDGKRILYYNMNNVCVVLNSGGSTQITKIDPDDDFNGGPSEDDSDDENDDDPSEDDSDDNLNGGPSEDKSDDSNGGPSKDDSGDENDDDSNGGPSEDKSDDKNDD